MNVVIDKEVPPPSGTNEGKIATIIVHRVEQDGQSYTQAAVLENTRLNVSRPSEIDAIGALGSAFWDSFKLTEQPTDSDLDLGLQALQTGTMGEFGLAFRFQHGSTPENF